MHYVDELSVGVELEAYGDHAAVTKVFASLGKSQDGNLDITNTELMC